MTTAIDLEIVPAIEEKLVAFAGKTGLEQTSTTPLVAAFRPVFVEARAVLAEAAGVAESVKDATCVQEIKKARACRLSIRRVRIAGEAVRKTQKATALSYGKAVDGFYNILEADLAPVEKALQDAEDTAERAETARRDAVEIGRKAAIGPYVVDVALYAVRDMTDPAFSALLTGLRLAKEQAAAEAAKIEAERIAKEKAEAAERERIRQENERLRKEAVEKEAALKAEREAARQEQLRLQAVAEVARQKAEAEAKAAADKARKEREVVEAKAAAEREARQKAEAEIAAAKAREEAVRIAAEAAKKKAAAAPDRDKLMVFAAAVRAIPQPVLSTFNGKNASKVLAEQVKKFTDWIETTADKLA